MWIEGWGELSGHLIVVSGPSGSGKTSIVRRLVERSDLNLQLSVSATTRLPRPGEVEGVDYYFYTPIQFKNAELLESAAYNNHFYGTPSTPVYRAMQEGKNLLLEIEVQGAKQIRKIAPESLFVFVKTPKFHDLGERLRARKTETMEAIHKRLVRAREELAEAQWYDEQIINDDLDTAVEDLADILTRYTRGG